MNLKEVVEEKTTEKNDERLKLFFSMLLGSKLVGHIHHLQCEGENSYAKHMALEEFYTGANELADEIIEVYQGSFQEIVKYDDSKLVYGMNMDPLIYLGHLKSVIQSGRELFVLETEPNIQSEIDDFISLIDKTVYKLTFLK